MSRGVIVRVFERGKARAYGKVDLELTLFEGVKLLHIRVVGVHAVLERICDGILFVRKAGKEHRHRRKAEQHRHERREFVREASGIIRRAEKARKAFFYV